MSCIFDVESGTLEFRDRGLSDKFWRCEPASLVSHVSRRERAD